MTEIQRVPNPHLSAVGECVSQFVQHVVEYSYSRPDFRRRFTAVETARAMPARVAEGSFPGRVLFGTLVFHLPSFFYDLRRNRFDVGKYGVDGDGGKKPR